MQAWEPFAIKLASSAIKSAVSAMARSIISPKHGAQIASKPARGRARNRILAPKELTDRDVEQFTSHVSKSLKSLIETEFPQLDRGEITAALDAVSESIVRSEVDILSCDLDPTLYALQVADASTDIVRRAGLGSDSEQIYLRALFEVSTQVAHFFTTWPSFLAIASTEQLKRLTKATREINLVKESVARQPTALERDFEQNYKAVIVSKLDQLELFGITLAQTKDKSYPLSTAYISLAVAEAGGASGRSKVATNDAFEEARKGTDAHRSAGSIRSETAISSFPRILLRGEAGSGKTTLLFWLAVNAARGSLENELTEMNGYIPLMIPLRRFADRELPSPGEFLSEVGKHISDEMPDGWVNRILRTGRAFVLIDGVDELPEGRRDEARVWLRDLISTYPRPRYILTSRPAAAEEEWLRREEFAALDLLPMGLSDIENFVKHWHSAALECLPTDCEESDYEELRTYETELITSIRSQRQIRRLASNPLLCALLCTLNRDRRMQLPRGKMELYAAALEMLLVRRDIERRIAHPDAPELTLHQKKRILGSFAYWLLRNEFSDCTDDQATAQVRAALESMPSVPVSPERVFKYLMVRSGVLRQPVDGRVDFVHKTFQEYLAAEHLIAMDDHLGVLIQNAHLDQWHEVTTMAVGHARPSERQEVLQKLIERGNSEPSNLARLHLLAAACLENADELNPETFRMVQQCAEALVPPKRFSEAKELAAVGEAALRLLPRSSRPLLVNEAAATVRTAALIGGEAALDILSTFGNDPRVKVYRELARAWRQFDIREYAEKVLAKSPRANVLDIDTSDLLDTLPAFKNLHALFVRCPVGDLTWCQPLSSLRSLYVDQVTGKADIASLLGNSSLSQLFINCVKVRGISSLAQFPHLTHLEMNISRSEPPREQMSLGTLPSHSNLRFIGISNCADRPFDVASSHFPSLTHVSLQGIVDLDLSGIEEFPRLHFLSIFDECIIRNSHRFAEMNALKQVSIINGVALSDIALIPNLRVLRVLALSEGEPIDLTPLAGYASLEVLIEIYAHDIEVLGEEDLGSGVIVEKRLRS